MKKIITACASGVVTSQTVASKVKSLLEQRGYYVDVQAVDIKSIDTHVENSDLYISITPYVTKDFGIPTTSGMPFLTNVGKDEAIEEIIELLNLDKQNK